MRKTIGIMTVLAFAAGAFAQADFYSNFGGLGNPSNPGLSTGAVTKSGVAAAAGFEWSEVQNANATESNTIAGFGITKQTTNPYFRLADDFTVLPGESFDIDAIRLYGYQTGSLPTANPFTNVNLQIWNGRPGDVGSSVVYGDTTTNRLIVMTNTNLHRVFNTVAPPPGTAPGTTRLIREAFVEADVTLGPGTYWIDWQSASTGTQFAPSLTVLNQRNRPGDNGRQLTTTGWGDMLDTGNPGTAPDFQQDLPFILYGTYVPEPASLMLLAVAGLALRRR